MTGRYRAWALPVRNYWTGQAEPSEMCRRKGIRHQDDDWDDGIVGLRHDSQPEPGLDVRDGYSRMRACGRAQFRISLHWAG